MRLDSRRHGHSTKNARSVVVLCAVLPLLLPGTASGAFIDSHSISRVQFDDGLETGILTSGEDIGAQLDLSRQTPAGNVLLRTGTYRSVSSGAALAEIDVDTKVQVSGPSSSNYTSVGITVLLQSHYVFAGGPNHTLIAASNFFGSGSVAPGDSVSVHIAGGVFLGDFGAFFSTSENWTFTEPGPFTFEISEQISKPGEFVSPMVTSISLIMSIGRAPNSTGTTWVGFSDPGVSLTQVPEPSTVFLTACAFGAPLRRLRARRRNATQFRSVALSNSARLAYPAQLAAGR
jgi:hypothetical protein